jgi:hypothetical protein
MNNGTIAGDYLVASHEISLETGREQRARPISAGFH